MMLGMLGTGFAQAQYQPEKSKFSIEMQFAPFGAQPFSNMGLKGRYFFNEKLALRLNLDYATLNNKNTTPISENTSYSTKKGEITYENSFSSFAVVPGIEYHFINWERLSVYAGGELLYGMQFASSNYDEEYQTYNNNNVPSKYYYHRTTDVSGAIASPSGYHYETPGIYNRCGTVFGGRLFTGIDFYIYKGLYLGAELGLDYTYTSYGKASMKDVMDETYTMGTPPSHKEVEVNYDKGSSSSGEFNIRCEPKIRFGWRF